MMPQLMAHVQGSQNLFTIEGAMMMLRKFRRPDIAVVRLNAVKELWYDDAAAAAGLRKPGKHNPLVLNFKAYNELLRLDGHVEGTPFQLPSPKDTVKMIRGSLIGQYSPGPVNASADVCLRRGDAASLDEGMVIIDANLTVLAPLGCGFATCQFHRGLLLAAKGSLQEAEAECEAALVQPSMQAVHIFVVDGLRLFAMAVLLPLGKAAEGARRLREITADLEMESEDAKPLRTMIEETLATLDAAAGSAAAPAAAAVATDEDEEPLEDRFEDACDIVADLGGSIVKADSLRFYGWF